MQASRAGPRRGRGGQSRNGNRSADNSGDESTPRRTRRVHFEDASAAGSSNTGSTVKSNNSNRGGSSTQSRGTSSALRGNSSNSTSTRGSTQKPRRGFANNQKTFNIKGGAGDRAAGAQPSQPTPSLASTGSHQTFQQRYQTLKRKRETERLSAIENGFLADPNKPRTLAEAITPVGTCPDMCPEFERVERVVQNDVWGAENDSQNASDPWNSTKPHPDEARMVKKFRRAAAGLDEQLPSDLRPPKILRMTVEYLFDNLMREADDLANVHHFIWDRTRAIRNDFSIQQVSKAIDVEIAIDCYERIARFHILSLHQHALPEKPYDKYDAQQEREQLDKTLLSLMQYYDDHRDRYQSPNEAEFRAYCIIFQIQNPIPDLEDRIQTWPDHVVRDPRVRCALHLYAAACNVEDLQGPLKPPAPHPIAQENWGKFWKLINSNQISYLMACVAEIYFPLIRRAALNAIWKSYRAAKRNVEDWTLDELVPAFGFQEPEEVAEFCEHYGFTISERQDGTAYLNLESVPGQRLPDPTPGTQVQRKSELVESKRHQRMLSAVVRGMSVKAARDADLIEQGLPSNEDEEMDDDTSLFIPQDSKVKANQAKPRALDGVEEAKPENPFSLSQTPSNTSPFFSTAAPLPSNFPQWQTQQKPLPDFSNLADSKSSNQQQGINPPQPVFNFSNPPVTSQSLLSPVTETGDAKATSVPPQQPLFNTNPIPSVFTSPQTKSNSADFSFKPSSAAGFPNPVFGTGASLPTNPPAIIQNSTTTDSEKRPFEFLSSTVKSNDPSAINSSQPSLFPPATTSFPSTTQAQSNNQPISNNSSATLPSQSLFDRITAPSASHTSTSEPTTVASPFSSQPQQDTSLSLQSTPFSFPFDTGNSQPNKKSHNTTATPPPTLNIQRQPSPAILNPQQLPISAPTQSTRSTLSSTNATPPVKPPISNEQLAEQKKKKDSATFTQLAKTLITEPNGVLDQYVQFTVVPMIQKIRQQIYDTAMKRKADEFRDSKLAARYGLFWKELCRNRRIARQGRERRLRMAKYREERERKSRESSISATLEDFKRSLNSSKSSTSERPIYSNLDNSWATTETNRLEQQPHLSTTSHRKENSTSSLQNSSFKHRRSESENSNLSVARRRRDLLPNRPGSSLRQSFLDDSLGYNKSISRPYCPPNDTTRSTYFKLKAMGLQPSEATSSMSRKRPSPTDFDTPTALSPSKKILTGPNRASYDGQKMPPPQSISPISISKSAHDEDEELFAAVQQAKQAMSDSISWFKEEISRDEQRRKSASADGSPPDGLARFRTSGQAESVASSAKAPNQPPAYRNRDSKFVPRERYAHVLLQNGPSQENSADETGQTHLRHVQQPRRFSNQENYKEHQLGTNATLDPYFRIQPASSLEQREDDMPTATSNLPQRTTASIRNPASNESTQNNLSNGTTIPNSSRYVPSAQSLLDSRLGNRTAETSLRQVTHPTKRSAPASPDSRRVNPFGILSSLEVEEDDSEDEHNGTWEEQSDAEVDMDGNLEGEFTDDEEVEEDEEEEMEEEDFSMEQGVSDEGRVLINGKGGTSVEDAIEL